MRERGVTLLELLIAVTLLSLLSVAMFEAMRIGLGAFEKADDRLMFNRRAAGSQTILQNQLEGLMPAMALCGPISAPAPGSPGTTTRLPFFEGKADTMRFVSTYSLQQAWRGRPQILEMLVIPGEKSGVRLIVNEIPYGGPWSTGQLCKVGGTNPLPQFLPVAAGPASFVLADNLSYCRFSYLRPAAALGQPDVWSPAWPFLTWPMAVRVEMAPLQADPSRIQPITVTAPIQVHRSPDIPYVDQ
jgi:prepilin-type N-terminal cleavage/methylation domain-containing protein